MNLAYIFIKENSVELYDFFAEKHQSGCMQQVIDCCRDKKVICFSFKNTGMGMWKFGFIKLDSNINVVEHDFPPKPMFMSFCDSDWDFIGITSYKISK